MRHTLFLAVLMLVLAACNNAPTATPAPVQPATEVVQATAAATLPAATTALPATAAPTAAPDTPAPTDPPSSPTTPPAETPTSTLSPTQIPSQTPTRTPSPTATATRKPTSLSTEAPSATTGPTAAESPAAATAMPTRRATRVPPSPTAVVIPAPTLLAPVPEDTLIGVGHFAWQWEGPSLPADHYFDLRIWSAREDQAGVEPRGAVELTRGTEADLLMEFVPAVRDYGEGQYYWSVIVVRRGDPPQFAGEWAPKRWFIYREPTPTPTPTEEPTETSAP